MRGRDFERTTARIMQTAEKHYGCSFVERRKEIKQHILYVLDRLEEPGGSDDLTAGVSPGPETPASRKRPRDSPASALAPSTPEAKAARGSTQQRTPASPAPSSSVTEVVQATSPAPRPEEDDATVSARIASAAVVQYGDMAAPALTRSSTANSATSTSAPTRVRSKLPAAELPLVLPRGGARAGRTTVLVQADGASDAFDLSGDVGAVGRLTATRSGVILDLQGHRYAGSIVPCCTHLVVGISASCSGQPLSPHSMVHLPSLRSCL